jgi:hypothetical protein
MTVYVSPKSKGVLSKIAKTSDRHLREAARVYGYLRELDNDLKHGRISLEFWNVRDCAAGLLESRCNMPSGAPLWRLYSRQHRHVIALLVKEDGVICLLEICSRSELRAVESALTSAPQPQPSVAASISSAIELAAEMNKRLDRSLA